MATAIATPTQAVTLQPAQPLHSTLLLPSRRTTPDDTPEIISPPSLTTRDSMNIGALPTDLTSSSDREFLWSSKLPPLPTRTIAPGEKLPPARPAYLPSSYEESGPGDTGDSLRTLLPNASRASRRSPTLQAPRINVPAYSAQVVVAGARVLVATHHHLRCFELSRGHDNSPIWVGDTKEIGCARCESDCA